MKKEVMKIIAFIIGAMLPTMLYAQLNPKQGFVITNQNDTMITGSVLMIIFESIILRFWELYFPH